MIVEVLTSDSRVGDIVSRFRFLTETEWNTIRIQRVIETHRDTGYWGGESLDGDDLGLLSRKTDDYLWEVDRSDVLPGRVCTCGHSIPAPLAAFRHLCK